MNKKYTIILVLSFIVVNVWSQNIDWELRINQLFLKLGEVINDKEKLALSDSILQSLYDGLQEDNSFYNDFDTIKHIGKIRSDDNKICLYSWLIPLSDKTCYFAVFQTVEGECYTLKKLLDTSDNVIPVGKLSAEQWYGALYYDIVPFRIKKQSYYALLGWRKFPSFQQKMIDILDLSEQELRLGLPIVEINRPKYDKTAEIELKNRIVFEYDSRITMFLDYNYRKNRIEFDNLSPMEVVDGHILSYGADFSFNCYKFKREKWVFVEDIKVKGRR